MRWLAITLALLSCLAWRPSVIGSGAGTQTSAGGSAGHGGGGGGGGVAGVEARCTELGANCVCSEPFGANEGTQTITTGHDFSDSPSGSHCFHPGGDGNGGGIIQVSGGHAVSSVDVSADPDFDGDWALYHDNGGFMWLNPPSVTSGPHQIDANTRTYCVRYYGKADKPYSAAGSSAEGAGGNCETVFNCSLNEGFYNCRNKRFEMDWDNLQMQVSERADGDCPAAIGQFNDFGMRVTGSAVTDSITSLSPQVDFADCDDDLCRYEVCVDGEIQAGNNMQIRARIHSLETGVTSSFETGIINGAGAPRLPDFWGGDMFHSGPDGGESLTKFAVGKWDVDNNDWVGPACEIEGGC